MRDSTTSKEKVLKQIRAALIQKSPKGLPDVDFDSEIFATSEDPFEIQFAQQFLELNGKFVFCESKDEFVENITFIVKDNKWEDLVCLEPTIAEMLQKAGVHFYNQKEELLKANVGFTLCESLVARTGSIVISSKQSSGRRLAIYPNIHVVIAYTSQLVNNINDAFDLIKQKYGNKIPSFITTISGPSRTADIEKTLVQGAHGPKEIFVFLIDDMV